MIRPVAPLLAVVVSACLASPAAAPGASVAAVSQSPAPTPTVAPTASRTPIPLPNTALIDAPSASVVWALIGNDRLFRSSDRGEVWQERSAPQALPAVLSFIDDREGWAMVPTGGCCVPPPAGGSCGASVVLLAHVRRCRDLVADAPTGLDPAGSPVIYRTADGGLSWTPSARVPDPPGFTTQAAHGPILGVGRIGSVRRDAARDAIPSNPATGTIFVYRSTDGGATWAYVSTAPNRTQDVAFVTVMRWLQVASPRDAQETTDGGATWHAYVTDYQQAAPVAPAVVFDD